MSKTSLHALLLATLLFPLTLGSQGAQAQSESTSADGPSSALELEQAFMNTIGDQTASGGLEADPADIAAERAFLDAISSIESSRGAYASELPEQMLSLGLALQKRRRHKEAVDIFKRGVHLARINNGLYSAEQIPLLQGEINSLLSLGNYSEADDRQHYLYRVQVRSLGSGQERASALIEQAGWQYNAYRHGLGWQGFGRLTNMWDLYRLALNDIISEEDETSPRLLTPLNGMLRTQYLISSYSGESQEAGLSFGSGYTSQQEANRFFSFRSRSYKMGQSVISAIYDIQRTHHGEESVEAASALVMLGDWALWHNKKDEASQVYANAIRELDEPDGAQTDRGHMLAEPVPLPDMEGIRPLPPVVSAKQGDILLEFSVDPRGRVRDLVRLDENVDSDARAIRLMRELRKTQFRPRFESGQPVETDKLVRAYDIQQ